MDPEIAPESWPRLRNAFEHALDLSPAQRGPWLAAELADAPTLLLAAERMLDELDSADSPLERVAQSTRGLEPSPGQWVGTQRLLRRIGVGGMGEIWEAERVIGEDRQQVAVKLLAFGSGPAFAQRLDAERRVLARLNHPNICTLLDAGVDQLGRPYLALEYVEGETFTQWCYDRAVDLDARLALLLEVCDAVAYAHAHLVVHRDLKPANVLVGASGRVKLLDFGIAKMLDAGDQPSGATRMLTPAYASPEQARGLGVTTATDIYALGVLLYELVCEKAPYQLDGLAQDQLIDRLLNPLHPPASQVLKRGGRRRLAGRVADGLDAVIGKAMNPDPERRYQSVAALAEDLRRWGAGHPVQARPDHWSYRLRCFVRRHSLATSLALVTVVLVSGFGYALWQRYQAEKIALVEAQRERALSNQVSDFLVELFSSADPDSTDPDRVDLKILLDRGSDALLHGSINDPELAAGLAARIARVYASLGLYAEADQLLDGVQPASSVALSSARQADLAEARALSRFGSGDSAAAVALLRSALAWRGEQASVARARTLYQLAVTLRDRADYDGADSLLAEAAAIQLQLDPSALIRTHVQQAALAWLRGDLAQAQQRYVEALAEGERHLSPQHPDLARALSGLSLLAHRRSDYRAAIDFGERALAIHRQAFGEAHPICAQTLGNLGALYMDAGETVLAEQRLRAALAIQQPRRAELGPALSNTLNNLGLLAFRGGDSVAAQDWFSQALEIAVQAYGEGHPQVAAIVDNLGLSQQQLGDLAAAQRSYQRALAVRESVLGEEHPHLAYSHQHLGELALKQGRLDAAETHLRRALEIRLQVLGEGHPLSASAAQAMARLQLAQGDRQAAQANLQRALRWWSSAEGRHDAEIADAATELAELQAQSGASFSAALAQARSASSQLAAEQQQRLRLRWSAIEYP